MKELANYFPSELLEIMPVITKTETSLKLDFVANDDHSIHSGLVAVEAMASNFGLWEKLRKHRCLDPRKDQRCGYGPEVIIGQLICAFCSGGGWISDSEALRCCGNFLETKFHPKNRPQGRFQEPIS